MKTLSLVLYFLFSTTLFAQIFNYPWPSSADLPVEMSFTEVFGSKFSVAKDFTGHWQPFGQLNTLDKMTPGKAYFAK